MPPAVAPTAQVQRAGTPVGAKVVGTSPMRSPCSVALTTISLANPIPVVRKSSFSMASSEKPAQATMKIAAWTMEKKPADTREHRVAQVAMQGWRGRRAGCRPRAIAHHQIVSCTELFQKARNVAEIELSSASPMITYLPRAARMPPSGHCRSPSLRPKPRAPRHRGQVRASHRCCRYRPRLPPRKSSSPEMPSATSRRNEPPSRLIQARHDNRYLDGVLPACFLIHVWIPCSIPVLLVRK